ncbi:hypothetical protein MFUM_1010008 [Methylacidiphilum fumariolicum SolV]|uniref:Uncharacterized protein n=2 Tax=Candidatus Methylacidiphilum fumarolicum TaxID=591154 RepID=I0JVC1_METFB|nr:conserved protein of unknown function [Candidatus Methylacidiphilum fumarolicum]CCG91190.1 hypothetical protein MFUM_1010008 [Methylacidiphilum fumariolicum SolV]
MHFHYLSIFRFVLRILVIFQRCSACLSNRIGACRRVRRALSFPPVIMAATTNPINANPSPINLLATTFLHLSFIVFFLANSGSPCIYNQIGIIIPITSHYALFWPKVLVYLSGGGGLANELNTLKRRGTCSLHSC